MELVLDVGFAMARAAHERCAANDESASVLRNDLFATHSVLSRQDSALVEVTSYFGNRRFNLRGFGSDDGQIAVGKLTGISCSPEFRGEFVRTRHSQPIAVQSESVLVAPYKRPDF